jgi:hypothetical protein
MMTADPRLVLNAKVIPNILPGSHGAIAFCQGNLSSYHSTRNGESIPVWIKNTLFQRYGYTD